MLMITGGAGFIGINFIKFLIENRYSDAKDIVVVDKMTYASNEDELNKIEGLNIEKIDIANKDDLDAVFEKYDIYGIINFAAETHVDNSIKDWKKFVQSNIVGTINLCELALKHDTKKFIQFSTDEVFGSIDEGAFDENSHFDPRNPYSASKASAEHFVSAFANTYRLKAIIVNSSNNYGPYQNAEKLIPKVIENALNEKAVPVYGRGKQKRDWVYVEDTCVALLKILYDGKIGERYCIGGLGEIENLELVKTILDKMNISHKFIEFVQDRPGHDARYYTDSTKLRTQLKWQPQYSLEEGLQKTIEWVKSK